MAAAFEPFQPPPEADELLAEVIVRTGASDREDTAQALLERLAVKPDDAILEYGIGNGRLLAAVAARVTRGFVAGVDVSERMLRHARRRCGRFVADGRVLLVQARIHQLGRFEDARFDKLYGVHVPYFSTEPERDLREARRLLRPGGRMVLGYWPREDGAASARDRARASTARVEALLRAVGFEAVSTDRVCDDGRAVAWTTARR